MNKIGVIYCFLNRINGKRYIGQTVNERQRFNQHISSSKNEKDSGYNYPIHSAIRKYGIENFTYEILAKDLTIDLLNQLEIYYINFYDSINNGYNLIEGGNNASKPKDKNAKINMSKSKAMFSDEEIIELRLSFKNNESPAKIYQEKYSNRIQYQSFYNIWCGKRYSHIMPEVFDNKNRRVKYTEEIVLSIRKKKEENPKMTYKQLSEEFNIPQPTIVDIIKRRTWKHV